jgi:Putative porin
VNNRVLAAALAAALLCLASTVDAADERSELAQIRAQLQSLMQRMDKLEQENAVLRTQNEAFRARAEGLAAATEGLRQDLATQGADVDKLAGAEWAARVLLTGDMRYRFEFISDDAVNANGVRIADRYRDRIRARLGVEAQATEDVRVGIALSTAEGNDPRSPNQTLTDEFSRKLMDLDLAYIDWRLLGNAHLIGGKMKQPFYKQPQSLLWDNDINPEGIAVEYTSDLWFGALYRYWVQEVTGLETERTSPITLNGGQIGARLPVGSASNVLLAAHYYDLSDGQGRSPFFDGDPSGNSTVEVGTPPNRRAVLADDFDVINFTAELNIRIDTLALQLWADVARNVGTAELRDAWSGGVLLGTAVAEGSWELGASYHLIGKDAIFAQLFDSDFAGGLTDSKGWVLRAGYAPKENCIMRATYFINRRFVEVPFGSNQDTGYQRMQLDFTARF